MPPPKKAVSVQEELNGSRAEVVRLVKGKDGKEDRFRVQVQHPAAACALGCSNAAAGHRVLKPLLFPDRCCFADRCL